MFDKCSVDYGTKEKCRNFSYAHDDRWTRDKCAWIKPTLILFITGKNCSFFAIDVIVAVVETNANECRMRSYGQIYSTSCIFIYSAKRCALIFLAACIISVMSQAIFTDHNYVGALFGQYDCARRRTCGDVRSACSHKLHQMWRCDISNIHGRNIIGLYKRYLIPRWLCFTFVSKVKRKIIRKHTTKHSCIRPFSNSSSLHASIDS